MIFSKNSIFNKTFSTENPGILDFLLFLLKYGIIGAILALIFLPYNKVEFILIILASVYEEYTLFFWTYHSKNKLKGALMFAFFLSHFEVIGNSYNAGFLLDIHRVYGYYIFRIPALISHIAGALLAYFLVKKFQRNEKHIFYSWLFCVLLHWIWDALISPLFVCLDCKF